jgi:hypothetical protein
LVQKSEWAPVVHAYNLGTGEYKIRRIVVPIGLLEKVNETPFQPKAASQAMQETEIGRVIIPFQLR